MNAADPADHLVVYGVSADYSALSWESVGPLFKRASAKLVGAVDPRWFQAYESIASEANLFSRFTLDKNRGLVLFTCRSTDGDAAIHTLKERLDLLIELTNARATLETATGGRDGASRRF